MADRYFKDKLTLDIYLVGYSKQGESIVFIVKADDITTYCGVIDSYTDEDNNNITTKILDDNNISELDMLCWSHPDSDHSKGIEELLNYSTTSTDILYPQNLHALEQNLQNAQCKKMYKFIVDECEKRTNARNQYNIQTMSQFKSIPTLNWDYYQKDNHRYKMNLTAFSPVSKLVDRCNFTEIPPIVNEYSIGLWLELGEVSVVFCSDINNRTISCLTERCFPSKVDYIKIPHHGSNTSGNLLNKIFGGVSVACTTAFVNHKLPDEDVIRAYCKITDNLFCTNNILIEEQAHSYGFVKVSINASEEIISYEYKCEGNADIIKEF